MDTIGCLPVTSRGHQWALTYGTEFNNTALNEVCNQLSIKRIFSTHSTPKATQELKCAQLPQEKTKFLESNVLEWDELLPFACCCYSIFSQK